MTLTSPGSATVSRKHLQNAQQQLFQIIQSIPGLTQNLNADVRLVQSNANSEFTELINNIANTEKQLKDVQSQMNLKEKES